MRSFGKVAIIGVGLIGGSIGLALKKMRLADEVIGIFRRASTLKKALACGAIDTGVMSIPDGVRDADIIILATSVASIPDMMPTVIRNAKPEAIITDAGSTKGRIVKEADKLVRMRKSVSFIGSHPMAGSEQTGVTSARADLFDSAPCIITPSKHSSKKAVKVIKAFWEALGARTFELTPERHDAAVAVISHLPHVAAFSLAGIACKDDTKFAAEGFRDTTRIASSDPELWSDILLENKIEVLKSASGFLNYYNRIIAALKRSRREELIRLLSHAKLIRDGIDKTPRTRQTK